MRDMLELLRVQRHDFMNHLQVISGLLQLKKYERAFEYVRQVGEELSQAGVITRLGCPEIACAILVSRLEAHQRGIAINHRVETGMEKGVASELALAEVIRDMLRTAVDSTEAGRNIDIYIREKSGKYLFEVSFPCSRSDGDLALTANRVFMEEAAAKMKACLEIRKMRGSTTVMTLKVPAGKSGFAGNLPVAAESGAEYRIDK